MDAKASAHHGGSTRVLVPARVGGSGVAPSYGTAGGHDSTSKQPHTDDLRSINSSTRSLPFKPPGPATKEPSSSSLHGFLRGDTRDFLRDYYGVGGRDVSSHIVSLDVRVWRAWKHGSLAFGLGVCICLVALLIPLGWGAPDGSLSYWVYSLGFEQWFTAISTLVVLCEVGLAIPGAHSRVAGLKVQHVQSEHMWVCVCVCMSVTLLSYPTPPPNRHANPAASSVGVRVRRSICWLLCVVLRKVLPRHRPNRFVTHLHVWGL